MLGGIILKLSQLIGVTTSVFVWKLGILTPLTLLEIVTMAAYFLTPIYTLSEKRQLISYHIKGSLVAALGLWIVSFSVTFIKSVNQSSIKPCLMLKVVNSVEGKLSISISLSRRLTFVQPRNRLFLRTGSGCRQTKRIPQVLFSSVNPSLIGSTCVCSFQETVLPVFQ